MTRILAINGSYRDDGVTDKAFDSAAGALQRSGADVDTVMLRDRPIEFCLNCRACMQEPGEQPGRCVLDDSMHDLVDRIEKADGYILGAPTNFGSVTAIFKRFMERLAVYGYWPPGQGAPKFRKAGSLDKKAMLISSSAAPGLLGRFLFDSSKQLKMTAQTIGARPIGTVFVGLAEEDVQADLPDRHARKTEKVAAKLLTT